MVIGRESMLMQEVTSEMLKEWKAIWIEYRDRLRPNRKIGQEIIIFLQSKYSLTELNDNKALNVIVGNVLYNEPHAEKLSRNERSSPKAFIVNNSGAGRELYKDQDEIFKGLDIFVGLDLATGFYCVEGSSLLWDKLCAYQGLDEKDLRNFYSVAQYILSLKRFG